MDRTPRESLVFFSAGAALRFEDSRLDANQVETVVSAGTYLDRVSDLAPQNSRIRLYRVIRETLEIVK